MLARAIAEACTDSFTPTVPMVKAYEIAGRDLTAEAAAAAGLATT